MYLPTISASEYFRVLGNGVSTLATAGACALVTFGVDKLLREVAKRVINPDILQKNEEYFVYSIKAIAVISGIAVGCLIAPKVLLVELTARKMFEAMAVGLVFAGAIRLMENTRIRTTGLKKSSKIFLIIGVSSLVSFGGVPLLRLVGAAAALATAFFSNRAPSQREIERKRQLETNRQDLGNRINEADRKINSIKSWIDSQNG